ncbi:kinase [Inconstantimicrobium porci]|uniref:kinase n=1 Tax=Inconstantimicrobium porci TaxID=2652291 RepID=UPI0024098903|nr:kinase [Inconstantimicrobium porci]MDD6771619.1 kinase [Inconstantimicrobium porci]
MQSIKCENCNAEEVCIMESSSKIIILRGNSGSGKTTVAKELQKKLGRGTLLISQDVIRREMLWVKDGSDTKAVSLLIDLVKYGRKNCDYVILEGILYADWYKELFETVKSEFNDNVYAYYYDIPFEETLKRHETKPNCHDFGREDMKQWWRDKDFTGVFKDRALTKGLGLDETVEIILNNLNE